MNDDYRNGRRDRQRGGDDDYTLDRNFFSKAESLASLERYLKELVNEAQGVREAIADLKDEMAGDAAADAKVAAAQAAPKRRGRPPKAAAETAAVQATPKAIEKPAKAKNGRKRRKVRKASAATAKKIAPATPTAKAAAPAVTPKRRGRPPKAAAPTLAKSQAKPAVKSVPKKKPSRRKVAAKKVAKKPVTAKAAHAPTPVSSSPVRPNTAAETTA